MTDTREGTVAYRSGRTPKDPGYNTKLGTCSYGYDEKVMTACLGAHKVYKRVGQIRLKLVPWVGSPSQNRRQAIAHETLRCYGKYSGIRRQESREDFRLTIVYQIYNRVGALLNVGTTHHTYWRLMCLARAKTWWREVTSIRLQRFSSVQGAKERARQIVIDEHPTQQTDESVQPSRQTVLH